MLKEKIVIVTGASGLIGGQLCLAVGKEGGTAILADIDRKEGHALEQKINKKYGKHAARFYNTDITNLDSIKKLMRSVVAQFGRINALVNCAYPRNKNYGRIFEKVTYEDFCENVNMHLGGYFLMAQQAAKVMMKQRSGNIINIASIYGFKAPRFEIYRGTGMTMPVEYAAIKGAVISLTRYLASYLAMHNIKVNCVSPGGVFNNQAKRFVKQYSRGVLLGKRMARPEDITAAIIFLLSDGSNYITGENIVVDGGWTL